MNWRLKDEGEKEFILKVIFIIVWLLKLRLGKF